jgi:hypothetical protein
VEHSGRPRGDGLVEPVAVGLPHGKEGPAGGGRDLGAQLVGDDDAHGGVARRQPGRLLDDRGDEPARLDPG